MSAVAATPVAARSNDNGAIDERADGHVTPASRSPTPSATPAGSVNSPAQKSGSSARHWLHGSRRPKTSPGPRASQLKNDDARRDVASRDSASTAPRDSVLDDDASHPRISKVPSLPTIVVEDESSQGGSSAKKADIDGHGQGTMAERDARDEHEVLGPFQGITTDIPTGDFGDLDDFTSNNVEFSKRGSIMLGGKKMDELLATNGLSFGNKGHSRNPTGTRLSLPGSRRVLSDEERTLSLRVRSMYEYGDEKAGADATTSDTPENSDNLAVARTRSPTSRSPSAAGSYRESLIIREPQELAGGIEDWADVRGGEVDRYGFIVADKVSSRGSSNVTFAVRDKPQLQRVSTALKLASEAPRRKRTLRRTSSSARSATSARGPPNRAASTRSARQPGSLYSWSSNRSSATAHKPFRSFTNKFPHNRDRRLLDEASDMLTLPPGLADIAEQEEGGRAASEMKKKEWEREEKWRKMARVTGKSEKGAGMAFDFDTKDSKVISRTWKGVPDRWRATVWYAFLAASAKTSRKAVKDDDIIESFYALQDESSPDDQQIDMDVPRTINRHIMFRRRYRGGQRLLFRVLHAMSIYSETGYVQGMAARAATRLCYDDEEKAFIMLVRLWQLRGLDRLYQSGFEGLMEALGDFEKNWLQGNDIARKLEELGITSTSYGTRWYLTLFNYSIPFPAQLRVWDVFMLLGDISNSSIPSSTFGGDLDVLHATSAALIDATRDILLDSDFETAMKTLTSWIPIKDEDLLMKVAKAEWKQRKKRAKAG